MPAASPASTTPCPLDPDLLASLLESFLDALDDEGGHEPGDEPGGPVGDARPDQPDTLAIGVVGTDAIGAEIALQPLDPFDPVRSIYGFVAPAEWIAFGVVTRGTLRRLDDADGSRSPVRIAHVVTRDDRDVSVVRGATDPASLSSPGHGRVPDACRRVLGLPTPAPTHPVIELWASWWLERVLAECLVDPRTRSWPEVAASFPDLGPHRHRRGGDPRSVEAHLVAEGLRYGSVSWSEVRTRWAEVRDELAGPVQPAEAAWMDDGMFSRELLGDLPRLEHLVVEVSALVEPEVAERIERTLRAWKLA